MQRFDCLSLECPLWGPHLLEASAGTGKTFSIEHIYLRFLLESIEVEQILTITFTRAATRELKARIRANLEKALSLLRSQKVEWSYLQPHIGSSQSMRALADALALFDRAQIFTIHGFCFSMLREFAFEAGLSFSLPNPDIAQRIPERLKSAALDFLKWGLNDAFLSREQASSLLKKYESLEEIANQLLRSSFAPELAPLYPRWNLIAEKVRSEESFWSPDEILAQMQKSLQSESFAERIRQKYVVAIIDEFQDTDPLQWDIFQRLFLQRMKAIYLVGDPKQSIYRFRKADIYTYLVAREQLGEKNLYHLDTNFRSSKDLVSALNALFSRDWLHLPKIGRTLPFYPVKAGLELESHFGDEKGALHFVVSQGEASALFSSVFLPFASSEIERLQDLASSFALLVKDRYQAETALHFLRQRGIPAVARSHTPLGKTPAFRALQELFEAIYSFRYQKAAMTGPFGELPFAELKQELEEKGLVSFFHIVQARTPFPDADFARDFRQLMERLLEWEMKRRFSFEGLFRYLRELAKLGAEEGGRRSIEEADAKAVQILTLHVSKGLEFDIVFALGLSSRSPENEEEVEELNAEKLRQLYVAMTRAKRRLYVPLVLSDKESKPGTDSPLELFARHFKEGSLLDSLSLLSKKESVTFETLSSLELKPPTFRSEPKAVAEIFSPPSIAPSFLYSFTSLADPEEKEAKKRESSEALTLHTLPRGSVTGIALHQIFERLFSVKKPLWRDPDAIDALVEKELLFSSLAPWKKVLQQMVRQVVNLPLQAKGEFFSLAELEPHQIHVEVEFLYAQSPHFVKGFIDLLFCHRGIWYFLDWKSNWLGNSDADYNLLSLEKAMQSSDYGLQAALYAEALQRRMGSAFETNFGGAFYLFLRGCKALYIDPDRRGIHARFI